LRVRADARRLACLAIFALAAACAPAPPTLKLPGGSREPLSDPAPLSTTLERCATAQPMAAEIGLAGRAAGQRLRGTLHAGFAPPSSLRLEAVAPFGGPVFVLAGRDDAATLLLTREDRVVRGAPADILEALVGLRVSPAALHAWIGGCPSEIQPLTSPRRVGDGWLAADVGADRTLWFRPGAAGLALVAEVRGTLTVEFADHRGTQPARVRLRQASSASTAELDIRLDVDQVERGVALDQSAFALEVPATATPLTVDELRAAGPLRDARPES
jgi:outer membrane biogenesis lipoprotein LolB